MKKTNDNFKYVENSQNVIFKKSQNKKVTLLMLSLLILSLFTILYSLFPSNAYYTNIDKFLSDTRKADGFGGNVSQRYSNEFIVDGCGSGTMLDIVTGLCWNKDLNAGTGTKQWALNNAYPEPIYNGSDYNWTSGRVDTDYPAFKVCNDLTTAGYTDWRMPTRAELLTLLNETGAGGSTCTSLTNFGFTNCQNDYYWSSNQWGTSTTVVFFVGLWDGDSGGNSKPDTHYVACVRRNY